MNLIDLALCAHAADESERAYRYTADVKARANKIRTLVGEVFGVPFDEAFDASKAQVKNEGYTLEIDRSIYLHIDEDGLEVVVYRPGCGEFVGRKTFRYVGEQYHQENLIALGYILAQTAIA